MVMHFFTAKFLITTKDFDAINHFLVFRNTKHKYRVDMISENMAYSMYGSSVIFRKIVPSENP